MEINKFDGRWAIYNVKPMSMILIASCFYRCGYIPSYHNAITITSMPWYWASGAAVMLPPAKVFW